MQECDYKSSEFNFFRSRRLERDTLLKMIEANFNEGDAGYPSICEMADRFHISSRTFSRRLSVVGLSYRDIVSRVKRDAALGYLENSSLSIAEVSKKLGYHDKSNFTKAFKSWVGSTPGQYRLDFIQARSALGSD